MNHYIIDDALYPRKQIHNQHYQFNKVEVRSREGNIPHIHFIYSQNTTRPENKDVLVLRLDSPVVPEFHDTYKNGYMSIKDRRVDPDEINKFMKSSNVPIFSSNPYNKITDNTSWGVA